MFYVIILLPAKSLTHAEICNTLEEETFARRKFVDFWPIRESLFRKIFWNEASAKVNSHKILESRVIYKLGSKNGENYNKITKKYSF